MSLGSKNKTTSTSTAKSSTTPTFPGYLSSDMQSIANQAMALGSSTSPLPQQQVAGFNPDQLQAMMRTRGLQGMLDPSFANAQGIMQQVANFGLNGPNQAQLNQWINPYINNVLDQQHLRDLKSYDSSRNQLQQQQAALGAFGGSRAAISQQQLLDNFNQNEQYNQSNAYANAYNQGLSSLFSGEQMAGNAGQSMWNQAMQNQTGNLQQINALSQSGNQQQAQDQLGLDVNYQNSLAAYQQPYNQLQFEAGIINPMASLNKGESSNSSSTQTSTSSQSGSPLSAALGIGSMLAAPFTGGASLGLMGGLGSMAGGALGAMGIGSTALASMGSFGTALTGMGLNSGVNSALNGLISNPNNSNMFAKGGPVGYAKGGQLMPGSALPMGPGMMDQPPDFDSTGIPYSYIKKLISMGYIPSEQYDPPEGSDMYMDPGMNNQNGLADAYGVHAPTMSKLPHYSQGGLVREGRPNQGFNPKQGLGNRVNWALQKHSMFAQPIASRPVKSMLSPMRARMPHIAHFKSGGEMYGPPEQSVSPWDTVEGGLWSTPELRKAYADSPIGSYINNMGQQEFEHPVKTVGGIMASEVPLGLAGKALPLAGKGLAAAVKLAPAILKSPAGRSLLGGLAFGSADIAGMSGDKDLNKNNDLRKAYDSQQTLFSKSGKLDPAHPAVQAAQSISEATGIPTHELVSSDITPSSSDSGLSKDQGLASLSDGGQRDEKSNFNMPLWMFGSALLSSDKPFFQALGSAGEAYGNTKFAQEKQSMTKEQALMKYAQQMLRDNMDNTKLHNDIYKAKTGREAADTTKSIAEAMTPLREEMTKARTKVLQDQAANPASQARIESNAIRLKQIDATNGSTKPNQYYMQQATLLHNQEMQQKLDRYNYLLQQSGQQSMSNEPDGYNPMDETPMPADQVYSDEQQ